MASSRRSASGGASPRPGQAADLAVAQAVVDGDEELAGRGDALDLASAALGDPAVVRLHDGVAALADDGRRRPSARGASLAW